MEDRESHRKTAKLLRDLDPALFRRAELEGRIYTFALDELEQPPELYKTLVDDDGVDGELSPDALWRLQHALDLATEARNLGLSGLIPIYGGAFAYEYSPDIVVISNPPTGPF